MSRAVDSSGRPLPWYTLPAITLLQNKTFAERSVLEFGAGQSTLWWAARAKKVVALESDLEWHQELRRRIPENVELRLMANDLSDFDAAALDFAFDVVVVDGMDRLKAARHAVDLVSEEGIVLLDDSDGFWGPVGEFPIIDFFRQRGFARIDLYGHAPGVLLPRCTSLFFRPPCFLFQEEDYPSRDVY